MDITLDPNLNCQILNYQVASQVIKLTASPDKYVVVTKNKYLIHKSSSSCDHRLCLRQGQPYFDLCAVVKTKNLSQVQAERMAPVLVENNGQEHYFFPDQLRIKLAAKAEQQVLANFDLAEQESDDTYVIWLPNHQSVFEQYYLLAQRIAQIEQVDLVKAKLHVSTY